MCLDESRWRKRYVAVAQIDFGVNVPGRDVVVEEVVAWTVFGINVPG